MPTAAAEEPVLLEAPSDVPLAVLGDILVDENVPPAEVSGPRPQNGGAQPSAQGNHQVQLPGVNFEGWRKRMTEGLHVRGQGDDAEARRAGCISPRPPPVKQTKKDQ